MKIVIMNPGDFRVEILDVEDSMIENEDVEMFLRSHGYDDNASWMAAPAWKVPVSLHEYKMDKDWEEEHTAHEMSLYRSSPGAVFYAARQMEIRELMAAVCKHGEVSEDGTHIVRFYGDCKPIVAGYDPECEPCDYVITRVTVSKDNHIAIYGEVKNVPNEEVRIDTDDIFLGHTQTIAELIGKEGAE